MRGWRTALRIARREARRAKGRSALVLAMIGVPVLALAFGAAMFDTFRLTSAERLDRFMGAADAAVVWPCENAVRQAAREIDFSYAMSDSNQSSPAKDPSTQRLLTFLPAGSRVLPDREVNLAVRTATGTGTLTGRLLDYADPLARGILRPVAGRPPATTDEVALTTAAVRRVGAGIGGEVRLAEGGQVLRVTGIVEDPRDLQATTLVLRGDALSGVPASTERTARWLVDTPAPMTWAQVKELNTHGIVAVSRYVVLHPPDASELYWAEDTPTVVGETLALAVIVAGLALLEIVLLAGPAFAVGARRRRRDLALIAAAGGKPAHLRRIVLADGVVLGGLAALGGVVLGVGAAAATRTLIEEHAAHARSGAFRVFPLALAVICLVSVVTGLLAALVPAWIAARQDVVAALAGRRGITRSRRRWMVVGAAMIALGGTVAAAGAWRISANIILAGLVLGELGLVLCTPAIVGLVARTGRWLPLAPRIALRQTSRNRTAAAPAISAVMAAVAGTLALGVIFAADSQRSHDAYRAAGRVGNVAVYQDMSDPKTSPQPAADTPQAQAEAITGTLRRSVPVAEVYQLDRLNCGTSGDGECSVEAQLAPDRRCPYGGEVLHRDPTKAEQRAARHDWRCDNEMSVFYGRLTAMNLVVDENEVAAVTNVPADQVARATATLGAGGVVVLDERLVVDGFVTLAETTWNETERKLTVRRTMTLPGYALPHASGAPMLMMSRATARNLGLKVQPFGLLATTTRMPTDAELDRLRTSLDSIRGGLLPEIERGPSQPAKTTFIVLAIVAGVITLGAAAIATGLAAADGRADLGTLAAVGASPRVRRVLSLSQSGVIAGLGSLLGAVAGLGASIAVLTALNRGYTDVWPAPTPFPIAVPWLNVGVALLVVPLIAMLGAGLLTRSRLPIERRL